MGLQGLDTTERLILSHFSLFHRFLGYCFDLHNLCMFCLPHQILNCLKTERMAYFFNILNQCFVQSSEASSCH